MTEGFVNFDSSLDLDGGLLTMTKQVIGAKNPINAELTIELASKTREEDGFWVSYEDYITPKNNYREFFTMGGLFKIFMLIRDFFAPERVPVEINNNVHKFFDTFLAEQTTK